MSLEALRAEARPGHCLACDEPLSQPPRGGRRVICDAPDCRRTYKAAHEMGRRLSTPRLGSPMLAAIPAHGGAHGETAG
jgi:hypothetical protein